MKKDYNSVHLMDIALKFDVLAAESYSQHTVYWLCGSKKIPIYYKM